MSTEAGASFLSAQGGLALYLLAVNAAAFAAFWTDKRRARLGLWRIRERTLLVLAALGGSIGAIAAQQKLRHKTCKEPFRTQLNVIGLLHGAIFIAACYILAGSSSGL